VTQDVDALLSRANLPTAQHRLCLDAELHARWREAEQRVAEAGTGRMSGVPADLREAADALRAEVEAASLSLTFRALPFAKYNALVLEHAPRKGNKSDEVWGFDTLAFFPALVRACTVDPSLTYAQWDRLLDLVTDAAFDELAGKVLAINKRQSTAIPFSSPVSEQTGV
jgi:hypothetical protein